MRIGAIHLRLEAFPQMGWLLPSSVDVQMKSVDEGMQWKYWYRC